MESAIRRYGDKDVLWSAQGMLRLMPAAMQRLYRTTLDAINDAVARILDDANTQSTLLRSVYSGHLLAHGRISPPQTAAKLRALNLFLGRDIELQICRGNFLLMDNKHRKLFVVKQSKGCKFMPKIHLNKFGSQAPPGPAALFQAPRGGGAYF